MLVWQVICLEHETNLIGYNCDFRLSFFVSGKTAIFRCCVDGEPVPVVEWSRGKHRKVTSSYRTRVRFDGTTRRHSVEIDSIRKTDAGEYTVMATNKFGSCSCQVPLVICSSSSQREEEEEWRRALERCDLSFTSVVILPLLERYTHSFTFILTPPLLEMYDDSFTSVFILPLLERYDHSYTPVFILPLLERYDHSYTSMFILSLLERYDDSYTSMSILPLMERHDHYYMSVIILPLLERYDHLPSVWCKCRGIEFDMINVI